MIPLLDAPGFALRTIIPSDDVATLASQRPGFLERSIALWQSRFYARLRKRYGDSLPFGRSSAQPVGTGTNPPSITLTGIPRVGSLALILAVAAAGVAGTAGFIWSQDGGQTWTIGGATTATGATPPAVTLAGELAGVVVEGAEGVETLEPPDPLDLVLELVAGGALGTAAFQWSQDGGQTWTIAPLMASAGTTPPTVQLVGTSALALPDDVVIQITTAGALGTAIFEWSQNGGATFSPAMLTSAQVPLGSTGLTAVFAPGVYATNNVYTGQGIATGAGVALGATGLTAAFSAGTYATSDSYQGQPVATSSTPQVLQGTGLSALFGVGTFELDNVYTVATPCPEVILSWLTACVAVDVYDARGANPQDPALVRVYDAKTLALAELKEAADSDAGLIDLPTNEDAASAVTTGGPLGFSDSSPYAWQDRQAREGRRQDARDDVLAYQGGPPNNRIVGN